VEKHSTKIQWHPGFCGAAELELRQDRESLIFEPEYNLSKMPLRMDLFIIKKRADVVIQNEIGRIFKRYNVLEYKSPEDAMTIDDYYKTIGYACLYKGLGETVNVVPAEELTVSLFREAYPKELLQNLQKSGAVIEEKFPGIYYISGNTMFATQIIVTGELDREEHASLRVLSAQADSEDIRRFLKASEKLDNPGDRHNVDAVLQVSVAANSAVYEKVKEEITMCEALRELMKDEIEQSMEQGVAQGIIQMSYDFGLSTEDILMKLQNKLDVTREQAQEYLQQYSGE
jgi:hypothetical protein